MRKHVVWSLVVLLCVGGMVGCKKEEVATTTTATTSASSAQTRGAAAKTTVEVETRFRGLISHVLAKSKDSTKRDRAVVLHDRVQHPVYVYVPIALNKAQLAAGTGLNPTQVGSEWQLDVTTPIAMRLVQLVGDKTQPYTSGVTASKTFETLTPSVRKASDMEVDEAQELKDSLWLDDPDGSDWILFYELDFGELSAASACKESYFKHKIHDKETSRPFAREVFQKGIVEGPIALEVRSPKSGGWVPVHFSAQPTKVDIKIDADPKSGAHFGMFERLAKKKPAKFDEIVYKDCKREEQGPDPSCSNSTWP